MEVIILPTPEQASRLVAEILSSVVCSSPSAVLGLATGRTMDQVYKLLVAQYQAGKIDFSKVTTFNLDEYIGLPANDPNSYHTYMDKQLFSHVNIDKSKTHIPDGLAADLELECRKYEDEIQRCGGIDLQILGIGKAGHIGFNEPLSALRSRTRPKALSPITIEQNSVLFGDVSSVPKRAITMGIGTILESKRCILLATGAEKAGVIARAVEGPITSMISATALQLHPKCTVVVDKGAAEGLKEQEYYKRIFETEPEWEPYRRLNLAVE